MAGLQQQKVNFTPGITPEGANAKPKKPKKAACFAAEVTEVVGDEERRTEMDGMQGRHVTAQESVKQDHSVQKKERQSTRVSKAHGSMISLDDFTQWTRSCGVFKIQHEYELLAEDAAQHGVSIEDEMRRQGFKNYDQFARSCERFKLTCWPGEFSELGSGFVLYYHFLVFLGVVLVMSLFAQVPALIYYGDNDNINAWYFHDSGIKDGNASIPNGYFLQQWTLTPGNLGPDSGDNASVIFSYMAMLALVCLLFIGEFQHQKMTDKRVDAETTSPSDFAIMVKGLPPSATDEAQIQKFFSQHAIDGKTTEIVKVVIGWDADDFVDEKDEIEKLELKILLGKKGSDEVNKMKTEVANIKAELYASLAKKEMECSGVVVVVFRYQQDLRKCLERWTGFWPSWLNRETEDLPCLPRGNGLKFGAPLPRFLVGTKDEPPVCLEVERAPNPGDIQWEKLGINPWKRYKQMALTNSIMLSMVFGAFWATYGLQELKDHIRDKSAEESGSDYFLLSALSLVPGLGVSIVNMFLSVVARQFGENEYHDSVTGREFAISFKMCLAMMINTSGVMVWTHWDPKEWYAYGGLVEDVLWVMIVDGILAHLFGFFDVEWIAKAGSRRRVTEERCKQWSDIINQNVPPATNENFSALKDLTKEVREYKKAFEPYEVDMAERFASAVNSFVFCFIFTPVLPILPLLALIGVIIQYWCDKYLLLRWLKRPSPQNSAMSRHSLKALKYLVPAFWCVSVFMYLRPSWDNGSSFTWFFFLCLFSSLFYSLVPLHVWALLVCRPCCVFEGNRKKLADESFEDYYNAQSIWQIPYHQDQFLYKGLSQEKNPKILKEGVDHTLKAEDYNYEQGIIQAVETASSKMKPTMSIGRNRVVTHGGDWQHYGYGWSVPAGAQGGFYGQSATHPGGYGRPPIQGLPQNGHPASPPNAYGSPSKITNYGTSSAPTPQGAYIQQAQANTYGQAQAFGSNPATYAGTFGSNPAAYGYNAASVNPGWSQAPNTASPQVSYGAPSAAYGVAPSAYGPSSQPLPGQQPPTQLPPGGYGSYGKPTGKNFEWPAATSRPSSQCSSWEFEQNAVFQLFPHASQPELEARYQAFFSRQAGNLASIVIGGIAYTVDFNLMSLSSPGTGTQRIRRRETE